MARVAVSWSLQGDKTLSALGILADATASANSSPRMNRSQPAPDDLDVSQEIQSKFDLASSSRASRSAAERAIKWLVLQTAEKANHLFLVAQGYRRLNKNNPHAADS
jgi:hypothetical protein